MGSLPCLILQGEGSLRLQRYEEVNLRHSQLLSARAFNIGEAILALVTLWMWRDPTLLPFSLLNFAYPITFRASTLTITRFLDIYHCHALIPLCAGLGPERTPGVVKWSPVTLQHQHRGV